MELTSHSSYIAYVHASVGSIGGSRLITPLTVTDVPEGEIVLVHDVQLECYTGYVE